MIQAAALLVLIASPAPTQAEIKYRVTSGGKEVGILSSWTTYGATSIVERTKLIAKQGATTAEIETTSDSSADGAWRKKTFRAKASGQEASIVATATATGAHVVVHVGGKKQERDVPKATKTTTKDGTVTWFRKYQPKPGESVTYQRFDPQSLGWSDVTLKYVGPKTVKVGSKSYAGFEVTRTEKGRVGKMVVDKETHPIVMENAGVKFERIYP